ncbi:hypothetical protein N7447_008187 [Penicillium robsamsonii]|uniref:uncharacterized protein n=1 Tax=Penicillium robsamsonii TaxID=1792511 RepID=UPI002546D09A|nr:uncharacterized protein N7447_008187 [Penicillium robsamsonii]KAJ5815954.1 hypothetical protein N7447_008187 [Penicillium robsamsonii]
MEAFSRETLRSWRIQVPQTIKVGNHLTSYWSIGRVPVGFLTSGDSFMHLIPLMSRGRRLVLASSGICSSMARRDGHTGNAQGCMLKGTRVDSALAVPFHTQLYIQRNLGVLPKKSIQRGVGVCIVNLSLPVTCILHLSIIT